MNTIDRITSVTGIIIGVLTVIIKLIHKYLDWKGYP